MNIAIIGGGLTGLSAGYDLTKRGHRVTIFEKDKILGGLAHGFKQDNWDWPLEFAYHHFFTNDKIIINLLHELGMGKDIIIKRPITATLLTNRQKPDTKNGNIIVQLDSPMSLLQFNQVSLTDRLRTGAMLGFMKINPFWQPLERYTAKEIFEKWGGTKMWQLIWEPLMRGKFGDFENEVAASWLWARIKKRTTNLGYVRGGFQALINSLEMNIRKQGGQIFTGSPIDKIKSDNNLRFTIYDKKFEKILVTTPTPIAQKIMSTISSINHKSSIINEYNNIPHLHAQMLVIETKEPVLNNVYWLNITDETFPFLALVQHTNMIDKKYYGGNHIAYIGNYLPDNHPYLKMTKIQLMKIFYPYLKKINPTFNFKLLTLNSFMFTGMYAQPVHRIFYSRIAPKFETGIPNIYLANMDSIYPWDRGTNYALELGQKAARKILPAINFKADL